MRNKYKVCSLYIHYTSSFLSPLSVVVVVVVAFSGSAVITLSVGRAGGRVGNVVAFSPSAYPLAYPMPNQCGDDTTSTFDSINAFSIIVASYPARTAYILPFYSLPYPFPRSFFCYCQLTHLLPHRCARLALPSNSAL